jgi:homoserine kinase type II
VAEPGALSAYDLAPPLEPFALDGQGVNNQTSGLRTASGVLVVKRYQTHTRAAALVYEHRLLRLLGRRGLPFAVPTPLPTRAGGSFARDERGLLAVFELLDGAAPDPRDPGAAEQVGDALGRLHAALAPLPTTPHPTLRPYGDLEHVHTRVPDPEALSLGSDEAAWWRAELAEVRAFAAGPYRALPRQITHGDFAPVNTLFTGGRLTAVLDFEMAQPDARAIDVASGLYFTLRPWEEQAGLEPLRAFCRGYARHIRLTRAEVDAIPLLVRLRNIVSVIWHVGQSRRLGREPERAAWRLAKARATAAWLEQHAARLANLIRKAVA